MNDVAPAPPDFVEIPVLDLARADAGTQAEQALAAELRQAAIDVGFFYIVGHGVPQSVVDDAFAVAGKFFAWPLERKHAIAVDARHRGFLSVGGAKMSDKAKPDLKESFLFGVDLPLSDPDVVAGKPLMGPNQWPADLPEMQIVVDRYASAVRACGNRILRLFAIALDLPADYFVPLFAKSLARGSLLYYPPTAARDGSRPVRGLGPYRLRRAYLCLPGRGRRIAGPQPGRRMGGSATPLRQLRGQHRRPDGALDQRSICFDAASCGEQAAASATPSPISSIRTSTP
jgi:hypothetical protein